MAVRAMLFDYSGTLFRLEEDESWASDLTHADGAPFDYHHQAEIMRRMTQPVGLSVDLDEDARYAWHHRDLDPELHRKAYLEILRHSGVPNREQALGLYNRLIDPGEWTPYPDTGEVLAALSAQGIRIAVVSNIAFDLRPAFTSRGWDRYVDEFVLSYEVGATKPDEAIFRTALDRLGVEGADAVMVGDSEEADGGATALGCGFEFVEPLPTSERPKALRKALQRNGIAIKSTDGPQS
ncbi:HAD-IA family hydrolase [Aldersonia sp. NBC_00410]|uniref:HAD family hydrolase n=1 Tax=Aldersonia sp. NBC_00410 TaxID=2975954 RepID=UPI00225866D8|nr:HAD-IA family hydrolase [Aldersonia sp. NBC_00410]MCX5043254.1 HAD-IA family hydrolase [Aldersonia sp. NBC_00410]